MQGTNVEVKEQKTTTSHYENICLTVNDNKNNNINKTATNLDTQLRSVTGLPRKMSYPTCE